MTEESRRPTALIEPRPSERALLIGTWIAAWSFPLVAWSISFVSQAHKLGRFMDDWCFPAISAATGKADWSLSPFRIFPFFWRPLLQLFLYAGTLLWDHQTHAHWLSGVAHAGVAFLLFLLCTRLGVIRRAAAAGALAFMLLPFHYEVVFWWTAVTTSLGTACALWLLHAGLSYARRPNAWRLMLLTLIAFAVPCWYEQASAAIAGLPLVMLAAGPGGRPLRARLRTAAIAIATTGVTQVVYIALLVGTAPDWARGSSGSVLPPAEWVAHGTEIAYAVGWWFTEGIRYKCVAMARYGLTELDTRQGLAALALLGVASGLWVVWWSLRGEGHGPGNRENEPIRPFLGFVNGVVVFFVSWLPIVIIRGQIVETRSHYFPAAALGLSLAFFLGWLARPTKWGTSWGFLLRAGLATVLVVGGWFGTLGLFGWQVTMRDRTREDLRQLRSLQSAVPNPPPATIFIPLADFHRPPGIKGDGFNCFVVSWVDKFWATDRMIQLAYRRDDLSTTACRVWGFPRPHHQLFTPADLLELTAQRTAKAPLPEADRPDRWADTVPFIIDYDGTVLLVPRLTATPQAGEAGETTTIEFPLVQSLLQADPGIPHTFWPR